VISAAPQKNVSEDGAQALAEAAGMKVAGVVVEGDCLTDGRLRVWADPEEVVTNIEDGKFVKIHRYGYTRSLYHDNTF
jgi:hypothetical protein